LPVVLLSELNKKQRQQIYDAILLQRSPIYLTTDDQYTTTIKLRVSAESYDKLLIQNNKPIQVPKTEVKRSSYSENNNHKDTKPKDERMFYFMSLRYSKFVGFMPKNSYTPRPHPVPWVLHKIEEIYDERHVLEIQELEEEVKNNKPSRMDQKKTMPSFTYEYFMKQHQGNAASANQVTICRYQILT
jgi:hypothetical protein